MPATTDMHSVTRSEAAQRYNDLSGKVSLGVTEGNEKQDKGAAIRARFVTPLDAVLETADGNRLPAVPLREAHELNALRILAGVDASVEVDKEEISKSSLNRGSVESSGKDERLDLAIPPLRTHPLFPELPVYGPPTLLRNTHSLCFRITSACLSTAFLFVIVLGAVFTSIIPTIRVVFIRLTFRSPSKSRPFHAEERRRATCRLEEERSWQRKQRRKDGGNISKDPTCTPIPSPGPTHELLEGGPDQLRCDARYYARRVGLEMEEFQVETEDGFILDLWHIFDPSERHPTPAKARQEQGPELVSGGSPAYDDHQPIRTTRYPILLIHGLLQSAGAYCCNDDDSLAFYLHKAGYDVWLGNNRCGFNPKHSLLTPSDPRMWAWNIRQMGVLDLPAFVSRVLCETGFEKLALVAHSQGTTQSFVALAKDQVPDMGDQISVFCALAPAVYAGPLIEKMYFRFMKVISPAMFRIFFGIHAFIPLMMTMHEVLPGKLYGWMGYLVFGFLFNWSDWRWDRGLRNRFFQFAPVYVSAESMRWWLGRECFAKHKCILSTEEAPPEGRSLREKVEPEIGEVEGARSWYDSRAPPFAIWVAGSDSLVDGRRLLRRFAEGKEPHIKLVHSKVIKDYEHLDVLWAIDSIEQVGSEVKQVIWQTMSNGDKKRCRPVQGV